MIEEDLSELSFIKIRGRRDRKVQVLLPAGEEWVIKNGEFVEADEKTDRVHILAAVERGQTPSKLFVELTKLSGACLLVFFQEPERFPDDFASGVVASGPYLAADKFLQFWG